MTTVNPHAGLNHSHHAGDPANPAAAKPPRPLMLLATKRTRFAEGREDIRGRHVYDSHGHDLGIIDTVLMDSETHHVRFMQVRTRTGFLGLHRHTATIPVDLITRVEPEAVYLDRDKHAIETAPKLGESDPSIDQKAILNLYAHYRLAPFWDPAYVAPLFHSHSHTTKHLHHPHA
jgi:sporulation protein YlmC with PRC-barrel domain